MASTEESEITPLLNEERQDLHGSEYGSHVTSGDVEAHQTSSQRTRRTVKLGRKLMCPPIVAHHWAVKVGDNWYEIDIHNDGGKKAEKKEILQKNKYNAIEPWTGRYAKSGAGFFGGGIVGVTTKNNAEINVWYEKWKSENPDYDAMSKNCQKFAIEFIHWLTDDNYKSLPRVNAGAIHTNLQPWLLVCSGFLSLISFITPYWISIIDYDNEDVAVFLVILYSLILCCTYCLHGFLAGIWLVKINRDRASNWRAPIIAWIIMTFLSILLSPVGLYIIYGIIMDLLILINVIWFSVASLGATVTAIIICAIVSCNKCCKHDQNIDQERQNNSRHFVAAEGGNAIACFVAGQQCASTGPLNMKFECISVTTQAVAGPGLGIFVDIIVADFSYSLCGNLFGWRYGSSLNNGIGVRNGNFEAHLLGLGGKVGVDGVEINTPIIGVNACCIL